MASYNLISPGKIPGGGARPAPQWTQSKVQPVTVKPMMPPKMAAPKTAVPKAPRVGRSMPARPAPPIDPGIAAINATEQRHITQATNTRNWLASVVGAMQQQQAQQNQNLLGLIGQNAGSFQAAGQAQSPYIQSLAPGGFIPQTAPQTGIGNAAASVAMIPGIKSNLAGQKYTDVGESLIANAARYATSLPGVYADKRSQYLASLAKFREQVRQFNVGQTNKQLAQQAQIGAQKDIAGARLAQQQSQFNQREADRQNAATAKAQAATAKAQATAAKSAEAYKRLVGQWTARARYDSGTESFNPVKRTDANGTTTTQPGDDPTVFLEKLVTAGIKPMDAVRIADRAGAGMYANSDRSNSTLKFLQQYLGAKRGIAAWHMLGAASQKAPGFSSSTYGPVP